MSDELQVRKQRIQWYNGKKAKPEFIARAIRALSMVLRVGGSEVQALEITGIQFRRYDVGRAFTRAAENMRQDGVTFKQAILAEDVFPRTVHELVDASSTAQSLQRNLERAAELVAHGQDVKKKLIIAMIQPTFMMALCLAVLFIASIAIIPGFITNFTSLGSEVPPMALGVMTASEITAWVLGVVIVVLLLTIGYWVFFGRRSERARYVVAHLGIRAPLLGDIVQLAATSRLFDLLASSLQSGRSEQVSLVSAAAGSGNEAIRQHGAAHAELMRSDGVPLKQFAQANLFPANARYLLAVAPSVKQEIDIMNQLAPEYRDEANRQLEAFTKTIEPTINYIVYAVAGLLIAAIVLPMYAIFPAIMELGQ